MSGKRGTIRTLVCDDETGIRMAFKQYLALFNDIEVVDTAADAITAMQLIESLQPDIAVLDIHFRSKSEGIRVAKFARMNSPSTGVVAYSGRYCDASLHSLNGCGVKGFVEKGSDARTMVDAIRSVATGTKFFDQSIRLYVNGSTPEEELTGTNVHLTPRQKQVVQKASEGLSVDQMALELKIKPSTVNSYIDRVHKKLGVHSAAHMIEKAHQLGLL